MQRLRKSISGLLCLFAVCALDAGAQSTPSLTVTGHISAEVITTLAAVETSQLNFGRFSPGPSGGDLIVTPESTVSVIGSVYPGSGSHNAASFFVTGESDAAYSITLPSDPVTITHMGTAKTMRVTDWRSVPEPTPGAGMLEQGFQTVYVGATLKVGTLTDNPVGLYTGTFVITFDFN